MLPSGLSTRSCTALLWPCSCFTQPAVRRSQSRTTPSRQPVATSGCCLSQAMRVTGCSSTIAPATAAAAGREADRHTGKTTAPHGPTQLLHRTEAPCCQLAHHAVLCCHVSDTQLLLARSSSLPHPASTKSPRYVTPTPDTTQLSHSKHPPTSGCWHTPRSVKPPQSHTMSLPSMPAVAASARCLLKPTASTESSWPAGQRIIVQLACRAVELPLQKHAARFNSTSSSYETKTNAGMLPQPLPR